MLASTTDSAPDASPDARALARVEASLRSAAASGRDAHRVGPFSAYLASPGAHPYLSVAVPEPRGAEPAAAGWQEALTWLERLFAAHRLPPRIEAMEELHPPLRGALERAGWRVEPRVPVLLLGRGALTPGPTEAPGLVPRVLAPDDLPAFLTAQARAFGPDIGDGSAWLAHLQRALAAGTVAALGFYPVAAADALPVAGATLQFGAHGDAELAGVFTVPEHRRRGLAAAVCRALIGRHLGVVPDGCIVWLSAAPGALGVYRRLGFVPIGHQLAATPS